MPRPRPVGPTEASFSAARLWWWGLAGREAGRCRGGTVTLAQMGEKARMLRPRSSAGTVRSSQGGQTLSGQLLSETLSTLQLTAVLHPCYALAHSSSPGDAFKVWGLFFC